jgi:hypothetical protein
MIMLKPAIPELAKQSTSKWRDDNMSPFTMQSFNDPSNVSWASSTAITRLVTLATVCNKAKFSVPEQDKKQTVVQVPSFQVGGGRGAGTALCRACAPPLRLRRLAQAQAGLWSSAGRAASLEAPAGSIASAPRPQAVGPPGASRSHRPGTCRRRV